MRRLPIVVSIVVVMLAGSLLSARVIPGTAAQDATPAAQASQQMLGLGQLTSVPGYELQLARVTFPPGSTVPPHTHPGGAVIYVESGTLGWTVLQGETRLLRAGAVATPEAQGEVVAVDTEVLLTAGMRCSCPPRTATMSATLVTTPSSSWSPTSTPSVSRGSCSWTWPHRCRNPRGGTPWGWR